MFLTWAVPRPTGSRTMYGCAAGAASAAGSGPAARQAPGCQVPGAFGHDGGLTGGLAGRPSPARPVPASPRVTPTATAPTTAAIAVAVTTLRIPRRRARLR